MAQLRIIPNYVGKRSAHRTNRFALPNPRKTWRRWMGGVYRIGRRTISLLLQVEQPGIWRMSLAGGQKCACWISLRALRGPIGHSREWASTFSTKIFRRTGESSSLTLRRARPFQCLVWKKPHPPAILLLHPTGARFSLHRSIEKNPTSCW